MTTITIITISPILIHSSIDVSIQQTFSKWLKCAKYSRALTDSCLSSLVHSSEIFFQPNKMQIMPGSHQ
jgi:hypothetical protein